MIRQGEYLVLHSKLEEVTAKRFVMTFGESDPVTQLLKDIAAIVMLAAKEKYVDKQPGMNCELLEMIWDILCNGTSSDALLQHWPEVYLAYMLSIDDINLTRTERNEEIRPDIVNNNSATANSCLQNVIAESSDEGCLVTGTLTELQEDVVVYSAAYSQEEKLIAAGVQQIAAADLKRDLAQKISLTETACYVKVFVVNEQTYLLWVLRKVPVLIWRDDSFASSVRTLCFSVINERPLSAYELHWEGELFIRGRLWRLRFFSAHSV